MLWPVLLFFFIPILLFRHELYEWMNIPPGHNPVLEAKRGYLNFPFFLIRAAIYFLYFILATQVLRRWSVMQDRDGNPAFTVRLRKVAFASLPLFAFALTFGAFDWLMGLEFRWFSTMWGPYIFAGAAGSSMSLLVLVITALRNAGYLKEVVTIDITTSWGSDARLPFSGPTSASANTFLGIANIPEENAASSSATRSRVVSELVSVLGRFFLAFGILLLQSVKKQPHRLCLLAG